MIDIMLGGVWGFFCLFFAYINSLNPNTNSDFFISYSHL